MKVGLICEGGGTKGAYTSGVLNCFIDAGIEFDYCVGISSGTINLMGYIAKQPEFLKNVAVELSCDQQMIGFKTIKNEGQIYGLERLFSRMQETVPFDKKTATLNSCECETGVYHIQSGEIRYFDKQKLIENDVLAKASCALLMLTKPIKMDNEAYMDAGLKVMIPIERSIEKGNDKHIFISTKEENFVRKKAPLWQRLFCKIFYPGNKHVQKDLLLRDERYNQQWGIVKQLEKEGKALVLRPSKDMGIKRSTQDKEKLEKWYQLGYDDTYQKLQEIKQFMGK